MNTGKLQWMILCLMVFSIGLWFYFKWMDTRQEVRDLDRVYKDQIDSIRSHYRELIKEDSITFREYSLAKQEAVRATEAADYYRKKYEHEKNKPVVRYAPNAVDSVLSAIYPR